MARDFTRYLDHSRLLSVSLVASLPVLALYEIGLLLTGSPVENHVSALVKRMIDVLGGHAYQILTALAVAGFIVALIAKRRGPGRENQLAGDDLVSGRDQAYRLVLVTEAIGLLTGGLIGVDAV